MSICFSETFLDDSLTLAKRGQVDFLSQRPFEKIKRNEIACNNEHEQFLFYVHPAEKKD